MTHLTSDFVLLAAIAALGFFMKRFVNTLDRHLMECDKRNELVAGTLGRMEANIDILIGRHGKRP